MVKPPESTTRDQLIECVDWVIKNRRTWKVLSTAGSGSDTSERTSQREGDDCGDAESLHTELMNSAIETAGYAPFHYDRRQDEIAEPWRFYWLQRTRCRSLAAELPSLAKSMKPGNKIPAMLNACGSLVIVTWLPEEGWYGLAERTRDSKPLAVNEEHLAAASAAVQNLLLALEARGFGTYWSSGGSLREAAVAESLGIGDDERLLAAVFVDDPNLNDSLPMERLPGKNHEKRSSPSKWCRIVE